MEPSPILLCLTCLRDAKIRRAWSVVDSETVCIRHAVASFGIEDDMEEHDLFESVYLELGELGYRDVY
jgi:hypothetical protein